MTVLDKRYWSLQIDDLFLQHTSGQKDFSIHFEVEKSTKREPNKAIINIYNLSKDRRQSIASDADIILSAGYKDLHSVIFSGDARDIFTSRQGGDFVTTIEAEDGGRSYRQAEISASFQSGAMATDVMAACLDEMGVGHGNLTEISQYIHEDGGVTMYSEGITITGQAWRVLDGIVKSSGLTWSIQNGALQLKRRNRPVQSRSILLSPETGLVGSPTREASQKRGRVSQPAKYNAMALMIPGLDPGRVVVIKSLIVEGGFIIKKVKYNGSTSGNEWYAELNLEEY